MRYGDAFGDGRFIVHLGMWKVAEKMATVLEPVLSSLQLVQVPLCPMRQGRIPESMNFDNEEW